MTTAISIVTEQEAKDRVCPAPRSFPVMFSAVEQRDAEGRVHPQQVKPPIPEARCLASQCMAWRWKGTHVNDPANPSGDMVWSPRAYGFCGLAGRPE